MTDSSTRPAGLGTAVLPDAGKRPDRAGNENGAAPPQGAGGEVHQTSVDGSERLTTAQGVVVSDNQNSLKAGPRGPTLMEDFVLREKIFHFDHERIPERVVHARGYGAHGHFTCTRAMPDLTRAAPFQAEGKETPVFVRFSTVAGSKGSMDLARDVRGFAVKFYTEEGNWDLVGNNIPVFFIQDPMKFPDLVHAVKPDPDRGFPQAQSAQDTFWDYISLTPEAMHMVMWQMSDRTTPRSFRMMQGFGVHTFRLVSPGGESTFVKFIWKPRLGVQSVLWDEAVKINGADPDYHRRDLWEAIKHGDHPQWDLCLQVFGEAQAAELDFDILDPTKLIPEEVIPAEPVGTLTLTRMVDNFFQETEQVAFCTQNVIPGIDFTDDPLLQGRNFSYLDTQLKRLGGPNFAQLPINAPRGCPVSNYHQDGHMQRQNRKGRVNYEPNGLIEGPREDPLAGYVSFAARTTETMRGRIRPDSFADHYSQARLFFRSQSVIEQTHIADALIFELGKCQMADIRMRMVAHLLHIDESLARDVATGLGLREMPQPAMTGQLPQDMAPSPALSMQTTPPDTFEGRVMGVLIADGFDRDILGELEAAVQDEGGRVEIVTAVIGGAEASDGSVVCGRHSLRGGKSVLFDAVVILAGVDGAEVTARHPAAVEFLMDAHNHGKFIGHHAAGPLLDNTPGLSRDEGYLDLGQKDAPRAFAQMCRQLRLWSRLDSLPREPDLAAMIPLP